MKVLFISQSMINLSSKGLYSDLIAELTSRGHNVTLVTAKAECATGVLEENGIKRVNVKVGDQFGVSFIKKGLVLLSLNRKIKKAINKYLCDDTFDLVLYATPPVTFANTVKYIKKRFGVKSYLMLKDIFPQNAVDINIMSKSGLGGLLYKYFKIQEEKLYKYSDRIGCMSRANIEYLIKNEKSIDTEKLEIFPNAVRDIEEKKSGEKDRSMWTNIGLDAERLTFIYGGNLGKPQGLDFLADALVATERCNCNFVIIGKGQEKDKLFAKIKDFANVYTFDFLPEEEYSKLCASCDVGMIVLDYRFTIPNYPSRLLAYLENSMPVFAVTDEATDIKELVESEADCGKWCYSNDIEAFKAQVEWFISNREKLDELGKNGYNYLKENFNTKLCVEKLERFIKKENL